jgi:hypothetical protein
MKKLFLLTIVVFTVIAANACPICGCGVGGFYIGLLPTYKSEFIGIRYQYSHYETTLTADPSQFSHDHYHQAELYGGITLGKHWQVLGFVPYHFNHQVTDDGIINRNGLGDVTVLANYKLWQTSKMNKNNRVFGQEFWIGAGLKLPTGKYGVDFGDSTHEELDDLLGDVNSQMGTGSTDFIFNAMYNIHLGMFGINTTANYKVNTINSSNFRYGDRFSVNSFAYYQTKAGKGIFMAPNIGLLYLHSAQNNFAKTKVNETGGYVVSASAGLDINIRNITVGTNVQLPFAQNFAHHQTDEKVSGLVHVTYTF